MNCQSYINIIYCNKMWIRKPDRVYKNINLIIVITANTYIQHECKIFYNKSSLMKI